VRLVCVALAVGAVGVAGCGGSDVASGPPVVTGQVLGDSVALAAKRDLENRGVFSARVGDQGGSCKGRDVRWTCELEVLLTSSGTVRDQRVYLVTVKDDGCWVARQTGTDVGQTGIPRRPRHPQVLKGCVD
jgi:multidrug efflux pump subunit AcrA (membrane-fusion protein)